MSINEVNRIKEFFSNFEIDVTYLEHDAVITSEEAAKTRGFELKQGIKAILFKNDKNEFVIVNVPADKKIDDKKVATILNWPKRKVRIATSQEVLEKTGCEVGSVPPFGHKEKIQILVDKGVYDNIESDFNIGLRTHSVKIKTKSMKKVFDLIGAKEGDFSK